MSTKIINVFGYVANDNQFIVKAQDFNIRINNNTANGNSETPNPLEYLLAGFAGSVSVTASGVAGTVSGSGATTDSSLTGLTSSEFGSVMEM